MNETSEHPALRSFLADVEDIVAHGGGETELTQSVADRLDRLLREDDDFLPEEMTRPGDGRYVMYPLHVASDGSFSVASAVWDVGQVTPIHDHGTWGVIGIYRGVEHERRYEPPAVPGESAPVYLGQHDLPTGSVSICCKSDADVHQVSCGTDVPCIGIHVYGADIGSIQRRAFDPSTGAVTLFTSAWASPARAS